MFLQKLKWHTLIRMPYSMNSQIKSEAFGMFPMHLRRVGRRTIQLLKTSLIRFQSFTPFLILHELY